MNIDQATEIVRKESSTKGNECVKVVVRCRPLFGKEIVEGRSSIVTMDLETSVISIKNPSNGQNKTFAFDSVYDENTTQRLFYDEAAYPLVESIFEGYNGTIFAYGQTGCGKTHTMQGQSDPPELRGVIPHAFDHLFDNINTNASDIQYMVHVSYLEIYNEEIRDLLSDDSKKRLDLKESGEGGIYVKDLTEVPVKNVEEINEVMERGFNNRTVGATLMNLGSSRSHSIFTIMLEMCEKVDGEDKIKAGKLNLVDLAGSERQSKTGASGARLKEGCKINLSLSALGNVIAALVDGKGKHIPYRDSKLTRLLQDSLGGNTKTVMVAAVSPADYNYDETLSTLRYANRAKNIKNKPIVNEDPKDAKLREYRDEIEKLKKLLQEQAAAAASGGDSAIPAIAPSGGEAHPISSVTGGLVRVDSTIQRQHQQEQDHAKAMLAKAEEMMSRAKAEADKAATATPQVVKEVVVKEVVSEQHLREKEALEEYNQSILNQRDQMGKVLEQTTAEIEAHKKEKELLAQRLQEFQSQIIDRHATAEEEIKTKERETNMKMAKQQADYRRAQIELKAKKKKQAQLKAAKLMLEAEKQAMEEEFKNAQEAAQANIKAHKKKNNKYKAKLECAREEIVDLTNEFQRERESLLDTIRDQAKESKMLEQLVELFLTPQELSKVWVKAKWDEEEEKWHLPRIKPKGGFDTIKLPTLGGGVQEGSSASGGVEIADDTPSSTAERPPSGIPPSGRRGSRLAKYGNSGDGENDMSLIPLSSRPTTQGSDKSGGGSGKSTRKGKKEKKSRNKAQVNNSEESGEVELGTRQSSRQSERSESNNEMGEEKKHRKKKKKKHKDKEKEKDMVNDEEEETSGKSSKSKKKKTKKTKMPDAEHSLATTSLNGTPESNSLYDGLDAEDDLW